MRVAELERFGRGDVWSTLVEKARVAVIDELASVAAWCRVCDLEPDVVLLVDERRRDLEKLERRLPGLEKAREKARCVMEKAEERYQGKVARALDSSEVTGSPEEKASREAAVEQGRAESEYTEAVRRVAELRRELTICERVADRLSRVREPEAPVLSEVMRWMT